MQNGWLSLTDEVAPKRRNTQGILMYTLLYLKYVQFVFKASDGETDYVVVVTIDVVN